MSSTGASAAAPYKADVPKAAADVAGKTAPLFKALLKSIAIQPGLWSIILRAYWMPGEQPGH